MATLLSVNPNTASLYEVTGTLAEGWVGFVFPEGVLGPAWGYFPVTAAWNDQDGQVAYSGLYVFAPKAPSNPAAFVTALWASAAAQAGTYQGMTMPVWVADPDAATLAVTFIPTAMSSSPIVSANVNLALGGSLSFLIPDYSYYACDDTSESLSITASQNFFLNLNSQSTAGFDPSLTIALTGENAGLWMLNAAFSFDPTANGGDLALHYNYQTAAGIAQIRYPLLDISAAGPKMSFAVSLDPNAPFDALRTRFAFQGSTVGSPIGSGFQSPVGQKVILAPQAGSALVVRQIYGQIEGGQTCSGFELDGPFLAALDPPTPSGNVAVMPGLAGSESASADGGLVLNFSAGASFCPFDPTTVASDASEPLLSMGGQAQTAWASVEAPSPNGTVLYSSQPPESAYYAPSATIASYLFLGQPLPTLSASNLPLAPFGAHALIADQNGAAVDLDSYEAFERHVTAPARRRAMARAAVAQRATRLPSVRAAVETTYATGRGLIVSSDDFGQTFSKVHLSTTTDSTGAQHDWSLTNVGTAMSQGLQAPLLFIVATRLSDGTTTLFDMNGALAFADWQLGITLDGSIPGQILILKYGAGSVSTAASQLGTWIDADLFNADATQVQTDLMSAITAINANAIGADADLRALYGPLARTLADASWNGVLAFSPLVLAMPTVVQGIVSTLPDGKLTGIAMGFAINALSGGGQTAPSISASSPFAVIDYELAPPTTAVVSSANPVADFEMNFIRTQCQNGNVASFAAQGTLTVNSLFGLPVALQKSAGGDATSNDITIVGTYQNPTQPGGQGTYTFAASIPSTFRFAYEWYQGNPSAKILSSITVDSVQYLPVSADGTITVSRYAMNGSLAYALPNTTGTPPGLTLPGGDLFDYDALQFVNLGLVLTETDGTNADPVWAFDVTQAGLSTTAATPPRPGLACDLPLTLSRMSAAGSLDQFGCQIIQVPTGWTTPVDQFDFALVYSLDLGRPGAFAASSDDLTATLVLGWTASGSYALGFGIDGMGQQRQLTLQGVMQLTVGQVGIAPLTEGTGTRLGLILNQCEIGFLGATFPPAAQRFEVALIGAPDYPSTRLLWYGSSGQVIPPGGAG